jgi:hypothetical protein
MRVYGSLLIIRGKWSPASKVEKSVDFNYVCADFLSGGRLT